MTEALTWLALVVGGMAYIALDTVRVLIVGRGQRALAAGIGFVEVVVFLLAISQVLSGPLSIGNVLAYAAGFGAGTWLGGAIEEKMAVGLVLVQLVTQRDCGELLDAFIQEGFGVTNVAARGQQGRLRIVFTVLPRRKLRQYLTLVDKFNPNAFVSVNDVRSIREAQTRTIVEMVG